MIISLNDEELPKTTEVEIASEMGVGALARVDGHYLEKGDTLRLGDTLVYYETGGPDQQYRMGRLAHQFDKHLRI